jgi:hypothetical protein
MQHFVAVLLHTRLIIIYRALCRIHKNLVACRWLSAKAHYLDKTVFQNIKKSSLKKFICQLEKSKQIAKRALESNTKITIRESFSCIIFLQFLEGTIYKISTA